MTVKMVALNGRLHVVQSLDAVDAKAFRTMTASTYFAFSVSIVS